MQNAKKKKKYNHGEKNCLSLILYSVQTFAINKQFIGNSSSTCVDRLDAHKAEKEKKNNNAHKCIRRRILEDNY